jgi:eukaryotic-like serine/threonine-protein kinase
VREVDGFLGTKRFAVVSLLGTGGMGMVYEVLDRHRNLRVALKTLRKTEPDRLLRFKDEFRTMRDVQHPNLVRLGELVVDGGQWFFTMEIVDGRHFLHYVRSGEAPGAVHDDVYGMSRTLTVIRDRGQSNVTAAATTTRWPDRADRDLVVQERMVTGRDGQPGERAFDEERLRSALRGLTSGLLALHGAGIVHRDIKPSNVMVRGDGQVVLLDFGIAACFGDQEGMRRIVGSPSHMAPEQAAGKLVGPEADWYAVGVMLFQALTGTSPYRGKTVSELLARKQTIPPPDPSKFTRDVPRDLAELSWQLMAIEPNERPRPEEILATLGVAREDASGPAARPARSARIASTAVRTGDEVIFVGRASELAQLRAAYRASREGCGVAAVVEGESGVGKSATVEALLRECAQAEPELLILRGRCHERESVPYKAFDRIVDDLSRHLVGLPAGAAPGPVPAACRELVTIFPVLGQVEALAAAALGETDSAGDLRSRAFIALRDLIGAVARARPVIAVIDDLQWADSDSVALLAEVMSESTAPPLFLLGTARQAAGSPACAAVAAMGCEVKRIELRGLSDDEASELAQRLLAPGSERDPSAVARLVRDANGHPMFIAELAYHVAEHPEMGPEGLRLDDALLARVGRLARPSRQLLELVAVAGSPTRQDALQAAANLTAAEYAEGVTTLAGARLVSMTGTNLTDLISPYHDRVREAVYGQLGAQLQSELHARLGAALEARGAEPMQLAWHFLGAGQRGKAAAHAEAGAQRAAAALAFDSAAELYRMALQVGGHTADRQLALTVALGKALEDAGRAREAAEAFSAAAELASEDTALDLRRRAAGQLLMGGHVDHGLAAARKCCRTWG